MDRERCRQSPSHPLINVAWFSLLTPISFSAVECSPGRKKDQKGMGLGWTATTHHPRCWVPPAPISLMPRDEVPRITGIAELRERRFNATVCEVRAKSGPSFLAHCVPDSFWPLQLLCLPHKRKCFFPQGAALSKSKLRKESQRRKLRANQHRQFVSKKIDILL